MSKLQQVLKRALADRRLADGHWRVLVALGEQLSFDEFRPLKQRALAEALNLHPASVSRSLHRLRVIGYLRCEAYIGRVYTYQLALPNNEKSSVA